MIIIIINYYPPPSTPSPLPPFLPLPHPVCYQIVSKTGARHTFRTDLDSRTRIASGVHSSDIQHNLERAEIAFLVLERVEYLDHYRNALRLRSVRS